MQHVTFEITLVSMEIYMHEKELRKNMNYYGTAVMQITFSQIMAY